ncbi:MAG: LLM class F420-dependent oxidoreductase [Actinomycetota bacterium]
MSRIGLQIPNFTFEAPDTEMFDKVLEMATAAEETGFDSVWVMDHFYQLPALGGPERPMLEAYTLLGALGARTERVRLGALVGGVTYRNPALAAKEATTLDVITKGRAILGLGAAWFDVEHDGLGFEFPKAGERIDRLEEAVQICKAMFTEEVASFDGKYYRIREARNVPRPVTPGGPPVMIGGGGEQRTLRVVARHADMWNFIGDPQTYAAKLDTLRRHCDEAGRDYGAILKTKLSTLVLSDSEEQAQATREMLAQVSGRGVGGFNVGTEKEVLGQIEELLEAGVEYFIFNMPLSNADAVRRAGELLNDI